MSEYKKVPIPNKLRQAVFDRDGYTCRYCGSEQGPFHCDHVYPERHGGIATIGNMATSCKSCNSKKGNKIGVWPYPLSGMEHLRELHRTIARSQDAIIENGRMNQEAEDRRRRTEDGMQLFLLVVGALSACGYTIILDYDAGDLTMIFVFLIWATFCGWVSISLYTKLARKSLLSRIFGSQSKRGKL